jgi:hypothetical protein
LRLFAPLEKPKSQANFETEPKSQTFFSDRGYSQKIAARTHKTQIVTTKISVWKMETKNLKRREKWLRLF